MTISTYVYTRYCGHGPGVQEVQECIPSHIYIYIYIWQIILYYNDISTMDLNEIKTKFCNIVKLLMGHVQNKSDILLTILLPHVTCQDIYD